MSYTIVIKLSRTYTKEAGKEWAKVGEDEHGKPVYGYTPPIEKQFSDDVEIYRQAIDDLDLPAVIMAVNGMKGANK